MREGTVAASATVLHRGGTLIVVETDLQAAGRRAAKTIQTQAVLRARASGARAAT